MNSTNIFDTEDNLFYFVIIWNWLSDEKLSKIDSWFQRCSKIRSTQGPYRMPTTQCESLSVYWYIDRVFHQSNCSRRLIRTLTTSKSWDRSWWSDVFRFRQSSFTWSTSERHGIYLRYLQTELQRKKYLKKKKIWMIIIGCAVYTGQDTKLGLNSLLTNNKFSTVEKWVSSGILIILNSWRFIYLFVNYSGAWITFYWFFWSFW